MCGNGTGDPRVTYRYDGPHSTQWMHIDLVSIIAYNASIDAAHRWANLMTQREGQMYVVDTKFNCDEKYDKVGLQLFWNIEVYEITIGFPIQLEQAAQPPRDAAGRGWRRRAECPSSAGRK